MNVIKYESAPTKDGSSLAVSQIRCDGGTQPRESINDLVVGEYTESLRSGVTFPPVVVFYDGSEYWLADGFHRHKAHVGAGIENIRTDIRQGTRRDAILYSVGANEAHGLRRTNDDKRRAVMTLLTDAEWVKWSDREIARRAGVSNQFVSNLRPSVNDGQMERQVQRNGVIYTQNVTAIGKGPALAADVERHIAGTALDTESFRRLVHTLNPRAQLKEAKKELRRRLLLKKERERQKHEAIREEVTANLSPAVKALEAAKAEAMERRAPVDASGLTDSDRIAELEEQVRVLEADYTEVVTEDKTYADMRVLFSQGGFEAVVKAKDEVIRGLNTRVAFESEEKVTAQKSADYWKKQAIDLGWKPKRVDIDHRPSDEPEAA